MEKKADWQFEDGTRVLTHCAGHESRWRLVWECLLLSVFEDVPVPWWGQDSPTTKVT